MRTAGPQRLRLSRRGGFDLQTESHILNGRPAVNVARPGKWGNPFIVGKHGTREQCVRMFELLCGGMICLSVDGECVAAQQKFLETAKASLHELNGKNLACWCALDRKPCHADVLLKAAATAN